MTLGLRAKLAMAVAAASALSMVDALGPSKPPKRRYNPPTPAQRRAQTALEVEIEAWNREVDWKKQEKARLNMLRQHEKLVSKAIKD